MTRISKLLTTLFLLTSSQYAFGVPAVNDSDDLLLLIPAIIAAQQRGNVSVSSKPGASNTGVRIPLNTLTPSGSLTITTPGTVIENLHLTGQISVEADNVTIRNCLIEATSWYGIRANNNAKNLLIEDVEIFDMKSAGIVGSDFTVRRANIHDSGGDAIKPNSNVLIEATWMHRLGSSPSSHSDGVQMVAGKNVTIRGNNIDMPYDLPGFTNSQCMIIQTNFGTIDNIMIEGNWLNGGGYCVQINDKDTGYGAPTNVTLRNNRFGRDYQFGIWRFKDNSPTHYGNVWDDTGEAID